MRLTQTKKKTRRAGVKFTWARQLVHFTTSSFIAAFSREFLFSQFLFRAEILKIFLCLKRGKWPTNFKIKIFFFKLKKNYFKSRPLLHLAPVGCCIITDHSHAVIRWRIFTFSRHMCSVRFFFFFFREVEKFQTPAEGKEKWRILLQFAFPGLSHRLLYAFWGLRLINWWNVESSD